MKGFRFLTVVFLLSISLPVSASEFLEDDTQNVSSSVRHEVFKAQPLQEGQVTWSYSLGRFFWAGLHAFIHFQNTNTNASYGQPSQGECLVTLRAMNSSLPIDNIWTAGNVPQEEDTFTSKYLPRFLGFLREKLLSIPLNLPQIPDDPRALSDLLPILYKKYVPAFENIPEFTRGLETKDILGELVLKGAAGSYIEKVACDKNLYKIDLSFYNQFPVKDGLSRLGAIAWFRYNAATNTMETEKIEYRKNPKSILKSYKKAETSPEKWNHKQRIMLATMLNDIGVGRHAADIHFIMASTFSSVNNRYLPTDHPMRSLMYLHQYQSISAANYKTPLLIGSDKGYFPCFASYDRGTLMSIIDERARSFDIARMNVKKDLKKRGMADWIGSHDKRYPYADNVTKLWGIIGNHVKSYIELFYPTEKTVKHDKYLHEWFEGLNTFIPNGIKGYTPKLNKKSLAKLVTSFIFTTSVEHDLVANFQLNYTIWQNAIPLQVPSDINRRPSIDVFNQYADLIIAIVSPSIRMTGSVRDLIHDHKAKANLASFRADLLAYDDELKRLKSPGDEYHLIFPSQLDAGASS